VTDFHGDEAKMNYFFKKIKKSLLHTHENQSQKSKLLGYQGWVKIILMITLVYSKRVSVRNNLLKFV
jgi:hypothetical protein